MRACCIFPFSKIFFIRKSATVFIQDKCCYLTLCLLLMEPNCFRTKICPWLTCSRVSTTPLVTTSSSCCRARPEAAVSTSSVPTDSSCLTQVGPLIHVIWSTCVAKFFFDKKAFNVNWSDYLITPNLAKLMKSQN